MEKLFWETADMVDEKKIKLMTEIALDESKRYKEEIAESGYFRGDYIRSHIIMVLCNVTIAYALVIALVVLYKADDLLINITKISYAPFLGICLGIYLLLMIAVGMYAGYYYSARYQYNMEILQEYHSKLEVLKKFSTGAGEETENDTVAGL